MALTPGTVVGQYEIRSPLGAGGMGEVYRAHDVRLGREVAIKVLPASFSSDPARLARFEQEARAAAALNHPNILAVYQMATHNDISYLVSELLEGETLRERMLRGPMSPHKTVEYFVQVAKGLAAAHDKGIVHRDLKLENLFVNKDGRAKILDFGLAKMRPSPQSSLDATLAHGTEPGMVLGTLGYMSPEQVRGEPADERSDIFAFGTILYEALTGKQTFRRPSSAETMSAILKEEPPPISQVAPAVPPGLQRIVHRCLEKNPELRFQSASDLAFALESLSDSAATASIVLPRAERQHSKLPIVALALALMLLFSGAVLAFRMRTPDPPKVSNFVQLTHDGYPKRLGATDGSRLYLVLFNPDYQGMAEMSVAGGEVRKMPSTMSKQMFPVGISSDGSQLLVMDANGIPPRGPFWSVPILGGSPRRLGDTQGRDAAWSPDGKRLAYTDRSDLYIANADGSEARKLISIKDTVLDHPVWSSDGNSLRVDGSNFDQSLSQIWEVSADGKDLHLLFPSWHMPPSECCGRWTVDGRYFVFLSNDQIWALPRKAGWFSGEPKPIQLTSSPIGFSAPIPSTDGKKLFTVGVTTRGELTRYDRNSRKFVPFLNAISAEYAGFSPDGQWVAYVSYPQGTLWRSKIDGSERLQLTSPPGYAFLPRWSRDGRTILFYQQFPDKSTRMYQIAADGGAARELLPGDSEPQVDPNWSPDNTKIVFGGNAIDPSSTIRILDLATSKVSVVPGSEGLYSPRWSPDGQYLVAMTNDSRQLLLYEFRTQKWSELARGTIGWLNWSHDGQSLYVLDGERGADTVVKVNLKDHRTERLLDLKGFPMTGHYLTSLSLGPDDSPLILRDAGTYDVYSLDWQEP